MEFATKNLYLHQTLFYIYDRTVTEIQDKESLVARKL